MGTTNILDLNNRVSDLEKAVSGGDSAQANKKDIATEFSTTTAYTAGCFVYYQGKLYQFNTDHSAGAWDPTDVVEANVTDQVVSNYNTFKDYTEKSDIAPTFSDTNNYNKGDLVYYEESLYQFTADHTAGAWTGTDAQQIDISDAVNTIPSDLTKSVMRMKNGTTLATLSSSILALSAEQSARATVVVNNIYWLHKALGAVYNSFFLGSTELIEVEVQPGSTPHCYNMSVPYGGTTRTVTEISVTSWVIYYQGDPIA